MRIERILVPVDFSDCSMDAVKIAEILARQNNAEVLLLYVEEMIIPYDEQEKKLLDPLSLKEHGRLANIRSCHEGLDFQRFVEFGRPSETILEFTKARAIDLIVMGTQGRTGLKRILPGSVATAVMQAAACPVLAIRSRRSGDLDAKGENHAS